MAIFTDGRLWLGGMATTTTATVLTSPFDDAILAQVHQATAADLDTALATATAMAPTMATLPRHRRRQILSAIARGIADRIDDVTDTIVAEAGKPRRLARGEVERAIATFDAAAAVLLAPAEILLPLDASPLGEGRLALVRRHPRGVVVAITPFNFPLNLVAHKLAPAFAAGCPVVLKPAAIETTRCTRCGRSVAKESARSPPTEGPITAWRTSMPRVSSNSAARSTASRGPLMRKLPSRRARPTPRAH